MMMARQVVVAKEDPNGDVKISVGRLAIAFFGLILAIAIALTPVILLFGQMRDHVGDTQKHENHAEKEARIDARHRLLIAPVIVKLDHMDEKLDAIHEHMEERPPE